jgi:manganese/zinc/iron transport system substrate-binding protein
MRFLLIVLVCLAFSSCSDRQNDYSRWIQDNKKLKVLSTIGMINDLVKQVGGEYVDTMTLIKGELDPHSYHLVKGDDEKLLFAQIIFYNGLGLEHGPSLQQYLVHHQKAISLGDEIFQQDSHLLIRINGQKDPHIWMDLSIWAKTIPVIVRTLSQYDPEHAEEFELNGKYLQELLLKHHQDVRQVMLEIPEANRFLVTSHDAFNYFTRAYLATEKEQQDGTWEKRCVAPEGLAPESQLSTTDIKSMIDHMKTYHIQVLFSESNVSQDSINKILQAGREQGLKLKMACCPLYVDAMGPAGSEGETYLKMMIYNARTIAEQIKQGNER